MTGIRYSAGVLSSGLAFRFIPSFSTLRAQFYLPFSGDQPKLGLPLDDGFKGLLKAKPKAVQYTMVRVNPFMTEESPLLTASTPELQAFVTKYADDDRLFGVEMPLTRKSGSAAK